MKLDKFLGADGIIDCRDPAIIKKAGELSRGANCPSETANACFLYVRDEILHSYDYQLNVITCKASDVLRYKTGYCYAKSHLLVSLLRANNIPAGLCYQRLTLKNNTPPFCIHGLAAVYLHDNGWYRIDARGNKEGVESDFTPPTEKLAFSVNVEGEADFPEVWPAPLQIVVSVLQKYTNYMDVYNNLPDIEVVRRERAHYDKTKQ